MWERFTERAKHVVSAAREEATRLNSEYVRTEHNLLGLCREPEGIAARALENLAVEIRTVIERYDNSSATLNGVLDTELVNAKTNVAEAALTWATGNVVHVLKTQNEKSKKRKLLSDAVAFLGTHYSSEESFDPAIKEQVKKGRMF